MEQTVVGIGASAGGLAALKALFGALPDGAGLAYVVVVHLAPEQKSHLAELLQPHTRMSVQQVNATTRLEPDHVYIIPPNAQLEAIDTHLRLSELGERRAGRAPIDHFFRTLASTHDGHSIGVILTGTGSDGALGIKAIKERGGLTLVQDPAEAEYDGMPQSAIATGLVDLILPLAELPGAIARIASTHPRLAAADDGEKLADDARQLLQKVFAQVRARTGRDFGQYKVSTVVRRISRRMQIRHVEELPAYLAILRGEPDEVHALADDLLITVTNFFREPEVFEKLAEDVLPKIFQNKRAEDDVRVWSVGCASGEEAYSLAILLLEESARHPEPPRLQVFASDLHETSLARARDGFYPGDVESHVGPERLRRWFHREDGGWRIRQEVRELVVFAPHNLLGDPPFSRLDLVSCRNLLIYLQRAVQRDVVELFHYALRPDGWLVLGTSEAVDRSEYFKTVHKKQCIHRKRDVPAVEPRLPVFPLALGRSAGHSSPRDSSTTPVGHRDLHLQLLKRLAPPSLLLGADDKVVHYSDRVGRYLVHPAGEPTTGLFKLVRDELRLELRSALHAARRGEAVVTKPVSVPFDDGARPVVMHVAPAPPPDQDGYVLVMFQEWTAEPDAARAADPVLDDGSVRERELETELELVRQRLQALIEEYETSQEEMKASNEELQSMNEELRSTMEELETSKEELQSMNEELQTVNQENRHKVDEYAQLSSDLNNLLVATDIATLFLDRDLRIMRFTPLVGRLFNVRPTDRGRPLSDLTHRLGYDGLRSDADAVLQRLIPIEREVRDESGRWYLTRLLPYRSADERIEGVVITFVDITLRRQAEESARESERRLQVTLRAADVGVWHVTLPSGWLHLDDKCRAILGVEATTLSRDDMWQLVHPDDRERLSTDLERASYEGRGQTVAQDYRILLPGGGVRWVQARGQTFYEGAGEAREIVRGMGVLIDVTLSRQRETEVPRSDPPRR